MVREAFGDRPLTPHSLRHTWATLHMARGTPLKWIQEQGGWASAKMLLDVYGHFVPREMRGFANALAPNDLTRPNQSTSNTANLASPQGFEPRTYCLGGSRSIQLSYGDAQG